MAWDNLFVQFKYCTVQWTKDGVLTRFKDGGETEAWPHLEDPHYRVISRRCGYGDDMMAYCREHDFCHTFLAEELYDQASEVLWYQAMCNERVAPHALAEEALVIMFQSWLRGDQEPIIAGADWYGLKSRALGLLGREPNFEFGWLTGEQHGTSQDRADR